MNACGIIFTDTFDTKIDELIEKRTLASIPFAGRYRLIDFPISVMVNAGVRNIGIITKNNYQSLMGHLRSGSEWDLDRKNDGLMVLPPFSTKKDSSDAYQHRLEALVANIPYIKRLKEKYIVLAGCNSIVNIDLDGMLQFHKASGAKLTILYAEETIGNMPGVTATCIRPGKDGKVEELVIADELPEGMKLSLNTFVMEREALLDILIHAEKEGLTSFRRDVIIPMVKAGEAACCGTTEKTFCFDNLCSYLVNSLALLERENRDSLFNNPKGLIITPARDSAPTHYGKNAVCENSLIGDGAVIEGTVRNSIIFRGARIEKDAVVENSVVMQDSVISDGAYINYAILDKFTLIEKGRFLSGYITHPFYCERNSRI